MNFELNISAGELFELIRPAMSVLAAFLSGLVLFHSRKRFGTFASLAWSLSTFAFAAVVFPLYLAVVVIQNQSARALKRTPHFPLAIPALYLLALLSLISVYLLRQSSAADTHLARATQARLAGDTGRVIREYRMALALEDDAHTHSLLAGDLEEANYLTEALGELRLAERKGNPDDTIIFRIATLLLRINHPAEARLEYERFLETKTCLGWSARECLTAADRVQQLKQLEMDKN